MSPLRYLFCTPGPRPADEAAAAAFLEWALKPPEDGPRAKEQQEHADEDHEAARGDEAH